MTVAPPPIFTNHQLLQFRRDEVVPSETASGADTEIDEVDEFAISSSGKPAESHSQAEEPEPELVHALCKLMEERARTEQARVREVEHGERPPSSTAATAGFFSTPTATRMWVLSMNVGAAAANRGPGGGFDGHPDYNAMIAAKRDAAFANQVTA